MAVVCPSVCPVPDSKSIMKGHRELKIDRKKAHDTNDPWPHLEVKRSKVKVTRLINAETENASYFPNFFYLVEGLSTMTASPTCVVTSKVKDQDNKVTSLGWCMFAHNSTTKRHRSIKIDREVVCVTDDRSKTQRSWSPGPSECLFKLPLAVHHHHRHRVARPSVSIAVSTSWRHFERSCARIHAVLRPRLWGRRSSSIVRSHVLLGWPARRRQSAAGRLMAAPRTREGAYLFC